MTVVLLPGAEDDLDEAFNYYESRQGGLGDDFLEEFRHAIDRILELPHGWHPMDATYRRCQFHRFPYGVIYRVDEREPANHHHDRNAAQSPAWFMAAMILHNTFAYRPYRSLS